MKLGLCASPDKVSLAYELGFDYVECALNALAAMSEEDYQELLKAVPTFPIPVSKCNCLLPGDVRPVGPEVSESQLRAYLEKAFSRASSIGVKVAVFGSGAARNVPEGWSHVDAWKQIADFLKLLAEYGEKYDITIAIEPLRRAECNIMNLVTEGTIFSALTNHPRIGVLGDTFHMISGGEPYSALTQAGKALKHIHVSHTLPDLSGRIYPAEGDGEDYSELFDTLKAMGYEGGVSIEAGCDDMRADGEKAIACLKKYL